MEPNTPPELTLGQRLAADTPTFFKKVEFVGLALLAVGGSLTSIVGLPLFLAPALLGVGTAFTVLSKFAVKDTSVLANPNATIQDYSNTLKEIPGQVSELKEGITNTVEAIKSGTVEPAKPVQDTPIVQQAPVIEVPQLSPLITNTIPPNPNEQPASSGN